MQFMNIARRTLGELLICQICIRQPSVRETRLGLQLLNIVRRPIGELLISQPFLRGIAGFTGSLSRAATQLAQSLQSKSGNLVGRLPVFLL